MLLHRRQRPFSPSAPKLTLTADVANFYTRFFLTSYFIT